MTFASAGVAENTSVVASAAMRIMESIINLLSWPVELSRTGTTAL